jgi:hypothetical protein
MGRCWLEESVSLGWGRQESGTYVPSPTAPHSLPEVPETIELEVRTNTASGLLLWQGVVSGHPAQGLRIPGVGDWPPGGQGSGESKAKAAALRGFSCTVGGY